MRRLVASLITIAITTSGCATYEGARRTRNAGIVIGVAGVAATAGGIVMFQRSDGGCPSGNGGNNCDGVSGAEAGALALTMLGITLLPYAIAFVIVGASGMEKHSAEAKRHEYEDAEQQRLEHERIAREQREADARDREHERIEREKAQKRDAAFSLLKRAQEAAHAGRCAEAIDVETQIRELDAGVHGAWFARDPDIKRCLSPQP